jgi:cytochrome P450
VDAHLPPGPKHARIALTYLTQRHTAWVLKAAQKRYGDAFTFRMLGGKTIVFVCDPERVSAVLTADTAVLSGDRNVAVVVGESSILVTSGAEHKAGRELLLANFTQERAESYRDELDRLCDEELDKLPIGEPVAMLAHFEAITLGVVMSAMFGERDPAGVELLLERFHGFIKFRENPIGSAMISLAKPDSTPPKMFVRVRDAYDAEVYKQLAAARQGDLEDDGTILSVLLRARDESGQPLSDKAIRDHITTLLIQGHSSTAVTMAWVIERLVRHPQALARVRAEARTDGGEYLDAVIYETLRLCHPSAPIVLREVVSRFTLGEYQLDPGLLVAANAYALHRRADAYSEPSEFRPERWLADRPDPSSWIPFGGSQRHCIGRTFAMYELRHVLGRALRELSFASTDQPGEKPSRRGIAWVPGDGARVVVQERDRSAALS